LRLWIQEAAGGSSVKSEPGLGYRVRVCLKREREGEMGREREGESERERD
jgi:hypothetical protein